ncbi:hypothetical protein E4U42_002753 [Claviceps africana]|uniref:Uncharacterized protein n=1 Tax=Claviceps africana TaxID=83212 RepID=A0A8K0J7T6_9HYPO|nr:hypothetical protein E4U42_002753 [Claviceps africana]
MAPAYSAKSPEDLRKIPNQSVLLNLTKEERTSPASRWSRNHLAAYRLLLTGEKQILDIFRQDHKEACPVCPLAKSFSEKNSSSKNPSSKNPSSANSPENSSQKLDESILKVFLDEFKLERLQETERELLQGPGGFFWLSLAQTCNTPQDSDSDSQEPREYPQRERRTVNRQDYVDSNEVSSDSSFSAVDSSGSDYNTSMQEPDEDTNEKRRTIAEELSVQLATDFVRYSLQLCLEQPDDGMEFRARMDRRRSTANIAGVEVTCEDDRGIAFCKKHSEHGWQTIDHFVASFEAKRSTRGLDVDDHTTRSSPVVTDDTLAQYLGEAVLTWRANQKLLKNK